MSIVQPIIKPIVRGIVRSIVRSVTGGSQSALTIPAYAVKTRDGSYVKDRDGNYVVNAPRP